ncbi:hypothetical protein KAH94_00880, partial [bacterium]|nr:hypothetical protein [bacterium]
MNKQMLALLCVTTIIVSPACRRPERHMKTTKTVKKHKKMPLKKQAKKIKTHKAVESVMMQLETAAKVTKATTKKPKYSAKKKVAKKKVTKK